MLKRKVRRVGQSLVITIPSQLVEAYGMKAGMTLQMVPNGSGILICKRLPV